MAWGGRTLHVVPAAAVMDLAFEQTGDLGEPRRLPRSTNDLNTSNFHNRRPLGDAFPPIMDTGETRSLRWRSSHQSPGERGTPGGKANSAPRFGGVFGASEDLEKFEGRIIHFLIQHGFPGRIADQSTTEGDQGPRGM